MKKLLLLLIPILFLCACGTNKTITESTDKVPVKEEPVKETLPVEEVVNLAQFFLPDQSTAQFKGEGNEYASYSLKTQYINDNYVATYEDNGGTIVQRIYKISEDNISLLAENGEAYEAEIPSIEELESMPVIDIYLATPLEVGTKFNGWEITSTSDTLQTDLQTFENVIVIEKAEEQGNVTRKYFAKDFGEIKREFIMNANEEELIVSSTIEKLL
ncbi:hypothetical protein MHB48_08395 [Psychrobacillus sp. FSL H8-0483]|uniref:hypothetical protein n=1 Tax=Psychrobacillus sp. FSL H8-0483 TaxID=2921389 RepID=UPI00315A4F20